MKNRIKFKCPAKGGAGLNCYDCAKMDAGKCPIYDNMIKTNWGRKL